jgi:hypothetical protein
VRKFADAPLTAGLQLMFARFTRSISCLLIYWSIFTEGEIPVPIPNTVVKPLRADGSVVVRLCESRSMLLKIKKEPAI